MRNWKEKEKLKNGLNAAFLYISLCSSMVEMDLTIKGGMY